MFCCACSSTKRLVDAEELQQLAETLESKSFTLSFDVMQPMVTNSLNQLGNAGLVPIGSTINRIQLQEGDARLIVKNDSIIGDLPYYGERFMNAPYGTTKTGITLFNNLDEFSVEPKDNKGFVSARMEAKEGTEVYQLFLMLYPENKNPACSEQFATPVNNLFWFVNTQ